jgi:predicted phage gp36 major capsid-like protein
MSAQRTTFDKLQRDRAKKAKAAAKRERRQEKGTDVEGEDATPLSLEGPLSAAELLVHVERLQRGLEAGTITLEEFEDQKADLMSRISLD